MQIRHVGHPQTKSTSTGLKTRRYIGMWNSGLKSLLDAVGEDFYVDFAFAGAVEFGEEDALPAA
jgi:hypothetical protein